MVACASRVGLRRYCTPLGEAGVTPHRRRRVAAILVVRGLLLGGGNVDGGHGLRKVSMTQVRYMSRGRVHSEVAALLDRANKHRVEAQPTNIQAFTTAGAAQ
jgi:hypothetical protein